MKYLGTFACAGAMVLATGCTRAGAAGGAVQASWTSSDTSMKAGHWSGPGKATWCARDGRLLLLATARDTGLGLSLQANKLGVGSFRVDTVGSARLALRIPGQEVEGYVAHDGTLELTEAGSRVTGHFKAELNRSYGGRAISAEGRFSQVPVTADTACAAPRQSDTSHIP